MIKRENRRLQINFYLVFQVLEFEHSFYRPRLTIAFTVNRALAEKFTQLTCMHIELDDRHVECTWDKNLWLINHFETLETV